MIKRNSRRRSIFNGFCIVLFLIGAGALIVACMAYGNSAVDARALALIRTAAADADRVEVLELSEDGSPAGEMNLTPSQSSELLALLKRHTFTSTSKAMCHMPAYVFRFYSGSSQLLKATVCLKCVNWGINVLGFLHTEISFLETDGRFGKLPLMEDFFARVKKDAAAGTK